MVKQRIEEFGEIFRFLTPILIGTIGWITIQYLSAINNRFESIDKKFEVLAEKLIESELKSLEKYNMFDRRLERLETLLQKEKE